MSWQPHRILTVCKGGHCRAPLAAAVLAHHGGDTVQTRAAAVRDWHIGEPAHPVMVEVARQRGYDLRPHRGVQVDPELVLWADTVIAMDQAVYDALRRLASPPTLQLFAEHDVPDPWQQPRDAFEVCVSVVEQGAVRQLAQLSGRAPGNPPVAPGWSC
ncbi:low molecular weight phosphotyrosine protein phosphatase [Kitasatospora sp. NPDC058170]|uniref:arsenate reductase/protein-tyrosine-phosphatase family protein n=1 Tax=Kitasatospora sp. NPDC058170 TaxID=3346364 RepID=UPI0036DF6B63